MAHSSSSDIDYSFQTEDHLDRHDITPKSDLEIAFLLQKEHKEASTLLSSSPFITGLVIKYAKAAATSAVNEELLRASNDSLSKKVEHLSAAYEQSQRELQRNVQQQNTAYSELRWQAGLRKQAFSQIKRYSVEYAALQDSLLRTQKELAEVKVCDPSNFHNPTGSPFLQMKQGSSDGGTAITGHWKVRIT